MDEQNLRSQLVALLKGGEAHVSPESALADIDSEVRAIRPADNVHSIWEELEHLRIAQEDILRYALDPDWKSPDWPGGYWPEPTEKVTDEMWEGSVSRFVADLRELVTLAEDTSLDLTSEFPNGEGRTYLRQLLLVADHNSYHLGQIVQARKFLGAWTG